MEKTQGASLRPHALHGGHPERNRFSGGAKDLLATTLWVYRRNSPTSRKCGEKWGIPCYGEIVEGALSRRRLDSEIRSLSAGRSNPTFDSHCHGVGSFADRSQMFCNLRVLR